MSTPRIALTNRTPERSGPDPAAPAAPDAASFPEVLGSAVNAPATSETGNGVSEKAHQRENNDAAKEETARPAAAPSDKAAAATDDAPGLQSRPRPNHPRDPGKHVVAGAAMAAPTVLSPTGPEPAPHAARSITGALTYSAGSKNESAAPHDAVRATMTDHTQKQATRTVDEPNGDAPRDPAPRQDDKSAGNQADLRADALQGAPPPSVDAAGSADPDIFGFGRELDLNSDGLEQAIATAARPRSAGDGRDAPLRSAPTSTEDRIRSAVPDLLPIVPIVEPGNTVPGGPTVEASASSSASSVLPTGLSDQVLHHVIGSIDNGGGQVVLRLHPPELGDLTVRILVNGRDVSAWFATPQIQVQQAISQAIGQLRVDLVSLGYNLAGTSVGAEAWSFWEPEEGFLPSQQGALHRSRSERGSAESSPPVSAGLSIYV
jgi:flagellar hook-length control protein FliK